MFTDNEVIMKTIYWVPTTCQGTGREALSILLSFNCKATWCEVGISTPVLTLEGKA